MAETLISPGVLTREQDISFLPPAALVAGAAFIGPTVKGPVLEPTVVSSYNEYKAVFGSAFQSGSTTVEHLTSIAAKNYFSQGGTSALITRVVSGSFNPATSTTVTASGSGAVFTLETRGKGVIFNNATGSTDPGLLNSDGSLVSGSADNIRWEVANINEKTGTFSLFIRRGDDSTKTKAILESYNNLSLDPYSSNYIAKAIGDQTKTLSGAGTTDVYLQPIGDYPNQSKYVRVASVSKPTPYYLANDGSVNTIPGSATLYSSYLPVASSGSFYGATGNLIQTGVAAGFYSNIGDNTQGVVQGNYTDAITLLGNKDEYVFNSISAPGLVYDHHSTALNSLISLAETRGDCIAIVDSVDFSKTLANAVSTIGGLDSSYAATYWPWLKTISETGKNVWVPAGVFIPGVYAFTDKIAAPWIAPAGIVKGALGTVTEAAIKLTGPKRDTLYQNNINPIATLPGTGIAVYGQKTLQKKQSALDRVNVRRLLIELKKYLGDVAKTLLFEQNTDNTRGRFLAKVNPYLKSVVEREGLYAFQVIMDETNNTADVIDRNALVGQILIQPSRTVEFIVLDFTVEPTGATFGA